MAVKTETKEHVAAVAAQADIVSKVKPSEALKHFGGVTQAWQGQTISLVCAGTFFLVVAHWLAPARQRMQSDIKDSEAHLKDHVRKLAGVGENMVGKYITMMRRFGQKLIKTFQRGEIMADLAQCEDASTGVACLVAFCNTHKIGTLATLDDWCNDVTPEMRVLLDKQAAAAREASGTPLTSSKGKGKGGARNTGSKAITMQSVIAHPNVASSAINKEPSILKGLNVEDIARVVHDRNPDEFPRIVIAVVERVETPTDMERIIKACQKRLAKLKEQVAAGKHASTAKGAEQADATKVN